MNTEKINALTVIPRPGNFPAWSIVTAAGRCAAVAYTETDAEQIREALGRVRMEAAPAGDVDAMMQEARDFDTALAEYVEGYEFFGEDSEGRDCSYTPNERERMLIEDAIRGWEPPSPQPAPAAQGGEVKEDDDDGLPVGYADWYNKRFRGVVVDTARDHACEEAWRMGAATAQQPVADETRQRYEDACAAIDAAHELSGTLAERITRLIEQRDAAQQPMTVDSERVAYIIGKLQQHGAKADSRRRGYSDGVPSQTAMLCSETVELIRKLAGAKPVAVDGAMVLRVAQHIGNAADYIDKVYPDAKMLDRGPIMRNMRRWHSQLTAALRSGSQGGGQA